MLEYAAVDEFLTSSSTNLCYCFNCSIITDTAITIFIRFDLILRIIAVSPFQWRNLIMMDLISRLHCFFVCFYDNNRIEQERKVNFQTCTTARRKHDLYSFTRFLTRSQNSQSMTMTDPNNYHHETVSIAVCRFHFLNDIITKVRRNS